MRFDGVCDDAGARMWCGSAIGGLSAKPKLTKGRQLIDLPYSYLSEAV